MSKILVDSEEYFKLKNRINELLETNKKLKEKYVYLEKRVGCDTDLSVLKETIDVLRKKQNEIHKKLENAQKENDDLKNANKELTILKDDAETKRNNIQKENDILKNANKELTILKDDAETKRNNIQKENDILKNANKELTVLKNDAETKHNNIQKENNKLNKMLEEFIRPIKAKVGPNTIKKEFNLDEFNKEYNAFIENLKKNKKNETI